ncbi:MAG: hypothetical protein ACD_10C00273G0001 [uncultured bacterium]|nr:MAG: hypothetical protein ACD_10C00273G0001 [uncultured bacterium]
MLFGHNRFSQEHIASAITQLIDDFFIKPINFKHFSQRYIGHFFQTRKSFLDQQVSQLFIDIKFLHKDRTGFSRFCF